MRKKWCKPLIKAGSVLLAAALVALLFTSLSEQERPGVGMTEGLIAFRDEGEDITQMVQGTPEAYPVAENDGYVLALTSQADVVVSSKLTGKTWSAVPAGAGQYGASVILHYYDGGSVEGMMRSDTDSVALEQFRVTQEEDGASVEYIFGDTVYLYPTQISEVRLDGFLQSLSEEDAEYVRRRYTYYNYDELVEFNTPEELERIAAEYPAIKNGNLYVLKELTLSQRKKTNQLFAEAGYTSQDKALDEGGGAAAEDPLSFYVEVRYSLTEDGFTASIDRSEVKFYESYPLASLEFLPYFGASTAGEKGWLLLPQGSGALLDIGPGKEETRVSLDIYGGNGTTERIIPNGEGRQCAFPMFGQYAGGSAYFCVITENACNAGIRAVRSGEASYIGTEFQMVDTASFTLSARNPANLFSKEMDGGKMTLRYILLPQAEENAYAAMAEIGRGWLKETGHLPSLPSAPQNTKLLLEFAHVLRVPTLWAGFIPAEKEVALTTFSQAAAILVELGRDCGVENLAALLTGWNSGGLNGQKPGSWTISRAAGGQAGLSALAENAKHMGVPLYADAEMVFTSKGTSSGTVLDFTHSTVPLQPTASLWKTDPVFAVTPSAYPSLAETYADCARNLGAGVSLSQLGNLLFADYRTENTITRGEAKALAEQAFRVLKENGVSVAAESGNLYALPYLSLITHFPIHAGHLADYDREIPFAAMLLHGTLPYVCPPLNLQEDPETVLLNAVESGSGLSYSITANLYDGLFDTGFSYLYPTLYENLCAEMRETYQQVNRTLDGLADQEIVDHEALPSGLRVVTYEDGTKVLVNYAYSDIVYEGTTVPARDYVRND